MSAETPRPPIDIIECCAMKGHADHIIDRLAAEGWHLVRDGQAVHDGQVYDLVEHWRGPMPPSTPPLYRLQPVSQGIPATPEVCQRFVEWPDGRHLTIASVPCARCGWPETSHESRSDTYIECTCELRNRRVLGETDCPLHGQP